MAAISWCMEGLTSLTLDSLDHSHPLHRQAGRERYLVMGKGREEEWLREKETEKERGRWRGNWLDCLARNVFCNVISSFMFV